MNSCPAPLASSINNDSLVVMLGLKEPTDELFISVSVYIIARNSTTCKWVLYRPAYLRRRILKLGSNMYPLKKGKTTTQAHVGLPEGTFEEEHGRKGFYGKSAHLYHAHPPTGWIRFEGKLRPHC